MNLLRKRPNTPSCRQEQRPAEKAPSWQAWWPQRELRAFGLELEALPELERLWRMAMEQVRQWIVPCQQLHLAKSRGVLNLIIVKRRHRRGRSCPLDPTLHCGRRPLNSAPWLLSGTYLLLLSCICGCQSLILLWLLRGSDLQGKMVRSKAYRCRPGAEPHTQHSLWRLLGHAALRGFKSGHTLHPQMPVKQFTVTEVSLLLPFPSGNKALTWPKMQSHPALMQQLMSKTLASSTAPARWQ